MTGTTLIIIEGRGRSEEGGVRREERGVRGFRRVYCSEGSQRVPTPSSGKGRLVVTKRKVKKARRTKVKCLKHEAE